MAKTQYNIFNMNCRLRSTTFVPSTKLLPSLTLFNTNYNQVEKIAFRETRCHFISCCKLLLYLQYLSISFSIYICLCLHNTLICKHHFHQIKCIARHSKIQISSNAKSEDGKREHSFKIIPPHDMHDSHF